MNSKNKTYCPCDRERENRWNLLEKAATFDPMSSVGFVAVVVWRESNTKGSPLDRKKGWLMNLEESVADYLRIAHEETESHKTECSK